MEALGYLLAGFASALSLNYLLYAFAGCMLGTLIGVLPGLGPAAGTAILIPITFNLDATGAIIMLAAIYYGAMYGGTVTSVLINVPGEAASVVTCIDGYAMAKQGRAGSALAIAAMPSAAPARPWRAIWWPSMQVTTEAASPGMLSSTDVVEPPYMAP